MERKPGNVWLFIFPFHPSLPPSPPPSLPPPLHTCGLNSSRHTTVLAKKEARKEGEGQSSHLAMPVMRRDRS